MRGEQQRSTWGEFFGRVFDPLRNWLELQPLPVVWRVAILGMALVFILDCAMAGKGLRMGPFYMLPICLACWRISFRAGLSLGAVCAILLAIMSVSLTQIPVSIALGNLAMNVASIGVLGGIVASFRHSVEHERRLASYDRMTGALTKPVFEQRAEAMLVAASAEGRPLLLTYLDLDGFKAINDQYGHEAGDEVLKRFALATRTALRREDCFGRIGGDEFAVLMPLHSTEAAQAMADRLHGRLTVALDDTAEVTCSMGALIVPPQGGATLKELMREADRLMYAVKKTGKDGLRVATAAPALEPDLSLFAGDRAASTA